MSVGQTETIDLLSFYRESGDAVLTVSDHIDWAGFSRPTTDAPGQTEYHLAFVEGDSSSSRDQKLKDGGSSSPGRQFVGEGVIVIAHRVESVEGISVIRCELQALFDAQRQVRICNEVTPEGHGIGNAGLDRGFCCLGLEAALCDDLPLENFPKLRSGGRALPLIDGHVSLYTWLYDVQVPPCSHTSQSS